MRRKKNLKNWVSLLLQMHWYLPYIYFTPLIKNVLPVHPRWSSRLRYVESNKWPCTGVGRYVARIIKAVNATTQYNPKSVTVFYPREMDVNGNRDTKERKLVCSLYPLSCCFYSSIRQYQLYMLFIRHILFCTFSIEITRVCASQFYNSLL